MSTKSKLNKLLVGTEEYFLLTKQETDGEDNFELTLCDGEQAWKGSVTNDNLHKQCKKLKMNYEEFIDETTKALTKENVGSLTFEYDVKATADRLELSWKKNVTAENIKFQLGTVTLLKEENAAEVIRGVLNMALEGMSALCDQIVVLETKTERLTAERAQALKKLEKYVSAKEELEQDLYSKFAVILNGKKAKLRELRICLEDTEAGKKSAGASMDGSGDAGNSSGGSLHAKAASDDEDLPVQTGHYDEDAETSDEERVSQAKRKKEKMTSCLADDQSDSLLLSEEEPTHTTTTARRRRRPQTAKKTSSKPVLPKVSSGDSPGTSRPRLKKSNSKVSSSSNRSSDNMDVDDMIEDM